MKKKVVIKFENVSKSYALSESISFLALDHIDLEIKEKEIFGIIGESGAGKSTLLRCLLGLEIPTEGKIFIDGDETSLLSKTDLQKKRRTLGIVFQNFNLLSSRTAIQNVTFPLEVNHVPVDERNQRAFELLELVGLKGKEKAYPAQLSGGEKQRVALARALANYPQILVCDEPTSALDPYNVKSMLELLKEIAKKLSLTILLITHQMEVIREICSHIAVLDRGKLVEQGKVADLFMDAKHSRTKYFLQHLTHDLPEHLSTHLPNTELLRLSFRGEKAKKPIISQLLRHANVEVNILLGAIDSLQDETIGSLLLELSGSKEERIKALRFLEKNHVVFEVIRS